MAVMALATGTNISFLDRLYKKNSQQCTLTCSGLQLAKQLDSQEDIVTVIVTEVVDCFWRLAFMYLREEMVSELMSFLAS